MPTIRRHTGTVAKRDGGTTIRRHSGTAAQRYAPEWTEGNMSCIDLKLTVGMSHFPLRSTRPERLFPFSASILSFFLLGANFLDG